MEHIVQELSAIQARVLGCLMEKKETTPEQYPLTLNALRNACNQKSARDPVTDYSEGEIGHVVRELQERDWVREEWGARTPKYSHRVGQVLGLHSRGLALLCVLMLRGPQTPGELKSHCQRLFAFDDLDDVLFALANLQKNDPPLVDALPRQAGQKEIRYMHLLCGTPEPTESNAPRRARPAEPTAQTGLEGRVVALEQELAELRKRLANLEAGDAG